MTTKSSRKTTKSSQGEDLIYDDWLLVLTQAFEAPGQDDYKSKTELVELTKTRLTDYVLEKRLRILLLEGKVETAKRLRQGPTGLWQRIFVYRLLRQSAGGG